MGLARVGGMCSNQHNCVIGELGVTNTRGKPYPSAGFTAIFVMAHEVGHVLGFNHPDTHAGMNLRATASMGPGVCLDPLGHVALAPNLTGVLGDTIMHSMTKHRSRNFTPAGLSCSRGNGGGSDAVAM